MLTRFKIGSQTWKIRVVQLPKGLFGDCDYEKKTIRVSSNQSERMFMDTLVHELIHALWPTISEDEVASKSTMLYRALWKMGYRRATK